MVGAAAGSVDQGGGRGVRPIRTNAQPAAIQSSMSRRAMLIRPGI